METSFSHKLLIVVAAVLAYFAYAQTAKVGKTPGGSAYYNSIGANRS